MSQPTKRRIAAYAAFAGQHPVLSAIRYTPDEAREAYLRHNPQVEGAPATYRVVPIIIETDEYGQSELVL